jgi:hypothetical protein
MSALPRVRKAIGSGLTRGERLRSAALGIALATGLGIAAGVSGDAQASIPQAGNATPTMHEEALVLMPTSAPTSDAGVVAYHYSHSSHSSHSSHYSHYSSGY